MRLICKYLLFIGFFIIGGQTALCQFTDTTQHHVSLGTTGSINRTNDGNSYLLNNGLKYNVRKNHLSSDFVNSWVYGRQNSGVTNNDFNSSLNFSLYKTFPHFLYWGLLNYSTSYSLKINNQFAVGAGVAYNIIDSKDGKTNYLQISDGILYDHSDLILPTGMNDVYHTYRNSFRLSYRFIYKDRVVFDGVHFLQNSLDRRADYIIRSTNNLSFKINKLVAFTGSLIYNRQNRTDTYNLLFTYGITFEKYF